MTIEQTESVVVLGNCKCPRCCCCPATVYYPPTLDVTWNNIAGSVSFTISCSYLACPLGDFFDRGLAFPDCSPEPSETINNDGKPCGHYADEEETIWVSSDCVGRCHGCGYSLLGADGTPGIKPTLVESNPPGHNVHLPSDTPYLPIPADQLPEFVTEGRMYITSFGISCQCWTGSGNPPAIFTYIEPDTGTPCAWVGEASGVIIYEGGINGWEDPTFNDCQFTTGDDNHCVNLNAWSAVFNVANYFDDFPNPPIRMFNPLDPWKFPCCPLRIRFLIGEFEPFNYAAAGTNGFWPDPSEWPPTEGEYIPWNFLILPLCCNYDGECDPDFECHRNVSGEFGYVDISGDAQCFLPADHLTNCLNALLPDDHPNKC